MLRDQRTGAEEEVRADVVVLAADALRTPQLLWASGIRPEALGRYLTEHPLLFGVVAVRDDVLPPREEASGPIDPIRAIVAIPFDEERHLPAQMMFSPSPAPLPEAAGSATTRPATGMGWGIRKRPRPRTG